MGWAVKASVRWAAAVADCLSPHLPGCGRIIIAWLAPHQTVPSVCAFAPAQRARVFERLTIPADALLLTIQFQGDAVAPAELRAMEQIEKMILTIKATMGIRTAVRWVNSSSGSYQLFCCIGVAPPEQTLKTFLDAVNGQLDPEIARASASTRDTPFRRGALNCLQRQAENVAYWVGVVMSPFIDWL